MWYRNERTGARYFASNSAKRQRRLVRRLRLWWRAMDGYQDQAWMVTLTYRHDVSWQPNHITDFLRLLIKAGGVLAHAWVAEVQPGTGRVHYHVIIIGSRPGWVMRRWGKGRTQVKQCWSVGYILKYLWKGKGGEGLPKGARRFGIGIKSGLLCRAAQRIIDLSKLPASIAYVCEMMGGYAERIPGGWITDWGIPIMNEWHRDLFQWG